MNEFAKFLMEQYEWLLIVIALIVITTIGFLADKKKTNKKKEIKNEMPSTQDVPSFVHDGGIAPQENSVDSVLNQDVKKEEPVKDIQNAEMSNIPSNQNVNALSNNNLNQQMIQNNPVTSMNAMTPNLTMNGLSDNIEKVSNNNLNNQQTFGNNNLNMANSMPNANNNLNQQMIQNNPATSMNAMTPNLTMNGLSDNIEKVSNNNLNNQNTFGNNNLNMANPMPNANNNLNQQMIQNNPVTSMNAMTPNLTMNGLGNNIEKVPNNNLNNQQTFGNNNLNMANSIPNISSNLNNPNTTNNSWTQPVINQNQVTNYENSMMNNYNQTNMNNQIQKPNNIDNSNMLQGLNNMTPQTPVNRSPLEQQGQINSLQPQHQAPSPTPVVHKPIEVQPIKGMTGGAINFVNGPQNPNNNN